MEVGSRKEAGSDYRLGLESMHWVCLSHLKCRLEVRVDRSVIGGD